METVYYRTDPLLLITQLIQQRIDCNLDPSIFLVFWVHDYEGSKQTHMELFNPIINLIKQMRRFEQTINISFYNTCYNTIGIDIDCDNEINWQLWYCVKCGGVADNDHLNHRIISPSSCMCREKVFQQYWTRQPNF